MEIFKGGCTNLASNSSIDCLKTTSLPKKSDFSVSVKTILFLCTFLNWEATSPEVQAHIRSTQVSWCKPTSLWDGRSSIQYSADGLSGRPGSSSLWGAVHTPKLTGEGVHAKLVFHRAIQLTFLNFPIKRFVNLLLYLT